MLLQYAQGGSMMAAHTSSAGCAGSCYALSEFLPVLFISFPAMQQRSSVESIHMKQAPAAAVGAPR